MRHLLRILATLVLLSISFSTFAQSEGMIPGVAPEPAPVNKTTPGTPSNPQLDSIRVEPNPFYGAAADPALQIPKKVTIQKLPGSCVASFYDLKGNLVRILVNESDQTELDWDLKNEKGIPATNGVYIIHVDAGELGERILKVFIVPWVDDGPTMY